jgi:cytoskeletal protein RodZ
MDQPRKLSQRTVLRTLVLFAGGAALGALWRSPRPGSAEPVSGPVPASARAPGDATSRRRRAPVRRLAVAAMYVALFVAGGALTAWGGNEVSQLAEDTAPTTVADTTTDAADPAVSAPAPAPEESSPAPTADETAPTPRELPPEESAAAPTTSAAPAPDAAPAPPAPQPVAVHLPVHVAAPAAAPAHPRAATVARKAAVGVDPEVTSSSGRRPRAGCGARSSASSTGRSGRSGRSRSPCCARTG